MCAAAPRRAQSECRRFRVMDAFARYNGPKTGAATPAKRNRREESMGFCERGGPVGRDGGLGRGPGVHPRRLLFDGSPDIAGDQSASLKPTTVFKFVVKPS